MQTTKSAGAALVGHAWRIGPAHAMLSYRGITAPTARTAPTKLAIPFAPMTGVPATSTTGYSAITVLSGSLRTWGDRTLDGTEGASRINVGTEFMGLGRELGELSVDGGGVIQPVTCTRNGVVLFGVDDKRLISAIVSPSGSMRPGVELTLPWVTHLAPVMMTHEKALVVGDGGLVLLSVGADGALARMGDPLTLGAAPIGALVNRDGTAVVAAGGTLASYRTSAAGRLEPAHSFSCDPGWTFTHPPFETLDGILVASQSHTSGAQRLCAFTTDRSGVLTQIDTRDVGPIDTLSRTNNDNRFIVSSGTTLTAARITTQGFVTSDTCTLPVPMTKAPVITASGWVAGFGEYCAFAVRLGADGRFGLLTRSDGHSETRAVVTRDDVLLCIRGNHAAPTLAAHKIMPDGSMPRVDAYVDIKFMKPAFAVTPQGHVLATHHSCLTVIGGVKP